MPTDQRIRICGDITTLDVSCLNMRFTHTATLSITSETNFRCTLPSGVCTNYKWFLPVGLSLIFASYSRWSHKSWMCPSDRLIKWQPDLMSWRRIPKGKSRAPKHTSHDSKHKLSTRILSIWPSVPSWARKLKSWDADLNHFEINNQQTSIHHTQPKWRQPHRQEWFKRMCASIVAGYESLSKHWRDTRKQTWINEHGHWGNDHCWVILP